MVQTLVFACCDPSYEDFAPLFAASVLVTNPHAAVEIGVRDVDAFLDEHGAAWSVVADTYQDRALLRPVSWDRDGVRLLPNTVRFLETPHTDSDYVYLSDVDFVVLEEIAPRHLEHMRRHDAPYSNVVRQGTRRLTGLHFTERAAHYPLPDLHDVPVQALNDEEVLYVIVERRGLPFYESTFRPQHGIHLSPQRSPTPTATPDGRVIPGWGIELFPREYAEFAQLDTARRLRPALSDRVSGCLAAIEARQ